MKEIERIADQLKRASEGDAWHGPAVMELLAGITAQQAAAHPLKGGAHSIWELVLHITTWERAVLRRLQGERVEPSTEEDWPAVGETSDEAWELTRKNLKRGNDELRLAISNLHESRLDEPIFEGMPSVYGTLHGLIQHDLYHAGQIALLKNAISEA